MILVTVIRLGSKFRREVLDACSNVNGVEQTEVGSPARTSQRDCFFLAEQAAVATHQIRPEGRAGQRIVPFQR